MLVVANKKFVAGRQSLLASNIQKMGLGKENLESINYAQVSYLLCLADNSTWPSIIPVVVYLPVSSLKKDTVRNMESTVTYQEVLRLGSVHKIHCSRRHRNDS